MKPTLLDLSNSTAARKPSTDLHDSVASPSTADDMTAADPLSVRFEKGVRLKLQTGDWLFRRGDPVRRLFVVERGSLDVVVEDAEAALATACASPGATDAQPASPSLEAAGASSSMPALEPRMMAMQGGMTMIKEMHGMQGRQRHARRHGA